MTTTGATTPDSAVITKDVQQLSDAKLNANQLQKDNLAKLNTALNGATTIKAPTDKASAIASRISDVASLKDELGIDLTSINGSTFAISAKSLPKNIIKISISMNTNDAKVPGSKAIVKNIQIPLIAAKKYVFNHTLFATKDEALKAQKDELTKRVDLEISKNSNKVLVYKFNGKEFLSKEDLIKEYKKVFKINKISFRDLKIKGTETEKKYIEIKNKIDNSNNKIFLTNGKLFTTIDGAIKEYYKHSNGDGSGKTFEKRLHTSHNNLFGGSNAILGLNKSAFKGSGSKDGKKYVTEENTLKKLFESFKNGDLSSISSLKNAIDHSNEFSKYKDEFLKVIKEFERFQNEDGDDWYYFTLKAENMDTNTKLPSGHTLQSDLFLSDAREVSSWKTFWGITTGIVYKKKSYWTLKDEVNASKNLKDLDKVWKIFSSATRKLHAWTKSNGHTYRSVRLDTIIDWKTSWINNGYKPNGALNRYKNNQEFNFNRRFEFNGKWFKDKQKAFEYAWKNQINNNGILQNIKDFAIEKSKNELAKTPSLKIVNFKDGSSAPSNATIDANELPTPSTGDGSGNTYVNVLATKSGQISNNQKTIVGKNFSITQIKDEFVKKDSWNNTATPKQTIERKLVSDEFVKHLHDGDSVSTLKSNKPIIKGRALVSKTNGPVDTTTFIFNSSKTDEELFADLSPVIARTRSNDKFLGNLTEEKFRDKISKEIKNNSEIRNIDTLISESNDTDLINLNIPNIDFIKNNKSTILSPLAKINGIKINYKCQEANAKNINDITQTIATHNFHNGDRLIISFEKNGRYLIREVLVTI